MAERMEATRGVLILLRALAERPRTGEGLLDILRDSGLQRDARTVRRWLEVLREESRVNEFRINRITEAKMLPSKFSPEAHRKTFESVKVRLSEKAFLSLGKTVVPDPTATVELLDDGGAIVTGTTPNPFWTWRELSAIGPEAEVLGSPKFKQEFLDFLQQTLDKYR